MSMSKKSTCYILADNNTEDIGSVFKIKQNSNSEGTNNNIISEVKSFSSESLKSGGPYPNLSRADVCILPINTSVSPRRIEVHKKNIDTMLSAFRVSNPDTPLFIVGSVLNDVESGKHSEDRRIPREKCEDYAERYGAIGYLECNPMHWESPYAQNNQTTRAVWEQVQEVAEFLKLRAEIEAEKQQLSSLQQQKSRAEQDYKSARTKQAKQVRVLEETRNQVVRDVVRGKKPISSASHQAQPKKKKSGWSFLGKKSKSSRKTDETSANRPVVKV